jgi:hypothetical protein
MKVPCLLLIGAIGAGIFAETVVKNSAAFSFPTTVGILGGHLLQNKDAVFVGSANLAGRNIITLSWSLPVKAAGGSISIFALSGAKIKSFQISSPQGYINWDISGAGRTGNGIYFATLSYGSIKKNLHLMICR